MDKVEFVVGQKNKRFPVFDKFVAAAVIGVTDRNRFDGYGTDFKRCRAGIQISMYLVWALTSEYFTGKVGGAMTLDSTVSTNLL